MSGNQDSLSKAINDLAAQALEDPTSPERCFAYAEALFQCGDYDQAFSEFNRLLSLAPHNDWLMCHSYICIGECCAQKGRDGEAAAAFENALKYNHLHPTAHMALAHLYARRGERDEAVAHCRILIGEAEAGNLPTDLYQVMSVKLLLSSISG